MTIVRIFFDIAGLTPKCDEAIARQEIRRVPEGRADYALGYVGYTYAMARQRDTALQPLGLPASDRSFAEPTRAPSLCSWAPNHV